MSYLKQIGSIEIFGRRVKIIEKDLSGEDDNPDGLFDASENTIYIHKYLDLEKYDQTLIHEVIHAILHRTGVTQGIDHAVEEIICESIATALEENFTIK